MKNKLIDAMILILDEKCNIEDALASITEIIDDINKGINSLNEIAGNEDEKKTTLINLSERSLNVSNKSKSIVLMQRSDIQKSFFSIFEQIIKYREIDETIIADVIFTLESEMVGIEEEKQSLLVNPDKKSSEEIKEKTRYIEIKQKVFGNCLNTFNSYKSEPMSQGGK